MWVPLVLAAAGAVQGANNQSRMKKNDAFRKQSIAMSPWTGMGDPGAQQLPGAFEGALKGAAGGMSITGGAGFGGGSPAAAPAPTGQEFNAAGAMNAASGALSGGQQLSTNLPQTNMTQAVQTAGTAMPEYQFGDGMQGKKKGSPGAMGMWTSAAKNYGSY